MPELTGLIEAAGAFVTIKVAQSPEFIEALERSGHPASTPVAIMALLDTGASISALDPIIAHQLALQDRGTTYIHTPSTGRAVAPCKMFDAMVTLDASGPRPLSLTTSVIEAEFASQGFLALIGRDILNRCILTFDGPRGSFSLSW